MSDLTRHIFHKSVKPRMQTENLAGDSYKQFYVLLNTNQIKLYAYPDLLKENPLLIKFLNSESTAYSLDETFCDTIYYFSQREFPLQYLLKPQNIARVISSIIHMT